MHQQSIRDRFERFHARNPQVYNELCRLAWDLYYAGHKRYSINGLFEVLRWKRALKTTGDDFKLNNDFRALYAREIMDREPPLQDFFETRKATASKM